MKPRYVKVTKHTMIEVNDDLLREMKRLRRQRFWRALTDLPRRIWRCFVRRKS